MPDAPIDPATLSRDPAVGAAYVAAVCTVPTTISGAMQFGKM